MPTDAPLPAPFPAPPPAPPPAITAAITAAVIGGGPAGLMAAEVLSAGGVSVTVVDAMPSVGRKFLLAGKGGLNLTHSEAPAAFVERYGDRRASVQGWLQALGPRALRDWAAALGVETFVGSSGRVFPADLKAAPLLRAWLHRLRVAGVVFRMRRRWCGWDGEGRLVLRGPEGDEPEGDEHWAADAVVLALGGASWPQLGSDGAWVPLLQAAGAEVAPLRPANCGFEVAGGWSPYLRGRFAGAPIKPVQLRFDGFDRQGEFVLSDYGIEGSLVYAASAAVREAIAAHGEATVHLDLLPDHPAPKVREELARPRGPRSLSTHLKSRLGVTGAKLALLHEIGGAQALADVDRLTGLLKGLPLRLSAPRPIAEAISTAGGVRLEALDDQLMLRGRPGVFCAGEMLDWEAPTGGYLLQASMASGVVAGRGALHWLHSLSRRAPQG